MKFYQILKVCKHDQMINLHIEREDGTKYTQLKPANNYKFDYLKAKKEDKKDLGVFGREVWLITHNVDCLEIWLCAK